MSFCTVAATVHYSATVTGQKTCHVHQIHLNGHCRDYYDTEKELQEASKQQLKGESSPTLLDLKQLKHLDLSCNDFGQIQVPEFIGSLGNLRYLNLSGSTFGGIIPPQLGNLSQLHTLCLGSFQNHEERQALLRFKHRLIDETDRLASWVGENDCCKWAGIACDNMTGHAIQIHLNGHCHDIRDTDKELEEASKQHLKGELSPSLLDMKQLEHLDLSCNDFGGIQVPEFIGSIRNLRYLNLSRCNFGGIIPPRLGNLSQLHTLCLGTFQYRFYFSWGVRTSVTNIEWLSNLHLLRHLDMSYVDLSKATDWFQVINTLPSLAELHLQNSNLQDLHPRVLSLNITSLLLLDLSENESIDHSLVPQWIFSIATLVSLDLSMCGFSSSSAHSFRNLTSLKWFHVSGNTFMNSSSVLKELSSGTGSNLISLHISQCDISSTALDSLHNLTSLLSLDLSRNKLTNIMPKSMGNFCNLRDIDLSLNNFQNISLTSLLESLLECKSPHLESLTISYSRLSGTIPDSIGRLSMLEVLDFFYNQLNGSLPESIGRLSLLKGLYLSHNKIIGRLPDSIGRLSLLKELYLSNNQMNGSLPNSLGQLSKLEDLDFSSNFLTVSRVSFLSAGKSELCFVGNKLCGDLLPELCSRVKTPDADHEEDDGSHGVDWGLIISVVSGFIVGFWVILVPLIVSRSWRIAYFRFLNKL
ncbi:leucine-rich repeat protein, partial [Tanacetum coccineum]